MSFRTTRAILARARNHGRAAASQGLAAGSLLADRAEASPAHRSPDPEPPMLASRHCKHSGVRSSWYGALSTEKLRTH